MGVAGADRRTRTSAGQVYRPRQDAPSQAVISINLPLVAAEPAMPIMSAADAEWRRCCRRADIALNRAILTSLVSKNKMDRAQEALRHDCPRSSSSRLHTTPGVNWLSGLRSKKLRPMQSPISIPTRSGRVTQATMGWETVTPVSTAGAAGVIWALDYLHRIGAVSVTEDFRPVLPKLLERTIAAFESNSPTDYAKHGSLLVAATWVRRLSPCALRPHRAWLIWFIRAQKQIWDCRSGS